MNRTLPILLALLLVPSSLVAQVRPPPAGARPVQARPAQAQPRPCELATDDGLLLAFDDCPAPPAGNAARELEVVEYRNGDAPTRAVRVQVGGVVHGDLSARALSWSDPDDDADGLPSLAADSERRAGGRMKVGRVTLRRTGVSPTDAGALPWSSGDLDGDGFPVTVTLEDPSGASTTVAFEGCRAAAAGPDRAGDVSLSCDRARMVAALDANPYARLAARGSEDRAGAASLTQRRAAPTEGTGGTARGVRPAARPLRALRLEGARLAGWSVDLTDLERRGSVNWTLEVRVDRIEG